MLQENPTAPRKHLSDFQSRLQRALGDDFHIEMELGGAGMSRVFVAVETALQRRVVIKVLPPELAAGVNIDRFRREIQLAAGLQHPHIVPLHSAGDDDGLLWFSMPFIEGESLRGVLIRNKRLPPRDVVRILHDVVDALAYAHSRGIVHRDIKPENILTSGMHAMVTDFGVAKALSAAIPAHGGTSTGMAIGTPAYMAPEQLAADPAADHRVDLYAVGLLAYELLTGQAPFYGSSPQATLAAQLTKMPEPPHRSLSEVPERLSAIVMSCLAKDAANRPTSAAQLLAELDALPPMGSGPTASVGWRRPSKGKMLAAAALLAVAMTFVFAQRVSRNTALDADGGGSTTTDVGALTPRDAGPGGSRTPGMEVAPMDGGSSIRAVPETVVVVLREGYGDDGTNSITVPVVISRADSLAIADAIRRRGGGATDSPRADGVGARAPMGTSDSGTPELRRSASSVGFLAARQELFAEVQKVFSDSMNIALRRMDSALAELPRDLRANVPRPPPSSMVSPLIAPNADGRLRIALGSFNSTGSEKDAQDASRQASRFFRDGLPKVGFEIVDEETARKAARTSGDRMAMGWMLRADFMISGVISQKGDSLSLVTILTDVKGGRHSNAMESTSAASNTRPMFEEAVKNVTGWLESAREREARAREFRGRGGRGSSQLPGTR